MSRALGLRTIRISKSSAAIALIVVASLILCICPSVQAQATTNFTPADNFSIPSTNGIISFAVNGSYTSATLQGNIWTFTALRLSGSSQIPIIKISTENSNMTITSYTTRNNTYQIPNETLRYRIVGEGKVTVSFGTLNATKYNGSDWYVSKAGKNSTIFFSLGHDYSLASDGTLTIYALTGTVSVTHDFLNGYLGNTSNLPFYQQHSVIIAVAVLVITVTVVIVIRLKNKPGSEKQDENGGDA